MHKKKQLWCWGRKREKKVGRKQIQIERNKKERIKKRKTESGKPWRVWELKLY